MTYGNLSNVDVAGALSLTTHSKLHLARLARQLMQRRLLSLGFSASCTVYNLDKKGN